MSENTNEPGKKLPEIDPEKLFDSSLYNTIKVGASEEKSMSAKAKKGAIAIEELMQILTSKTPGDKDTALALLKKENAVALLVDAIKECKNPSDKALITAACWETGMDFTPHLEFFAELSHDNDLFVSMEAITVVTENLGGIDKARAQQLVNILGKAAEDHFNYALIEDLIHSLKGVE